MRICRQNDTKKEALREHKPPPHLVWRVWNRLSRRETMYSAAPCVHILTISWISIDPLFPDVAKKHWLRQLKNESCIHGVKMIISKMFQIVYFVIADLSWKFHENLLIYFTVMLLTDTPPRLDGRSWNSLDGWKRDHSTFLVSCLTFHDIFIKIRPSVFP